MHLGPLPSRLCLGPAPPKAVVVQAWTGQGSVSVHAPTRIPEGLRRLGELTVALACGPSTRQAPGAALRGFWWLEPFLLVKAGQAHRRLSLVRSRKRISASCEHLRALLPQFDGRREDMASVLEMSVQFLRLAGTWVPRREQHAVSGVRAWAAPCGHSARQAAGPSPWALPVPSLHGCLSQALLRSCRLSPSSHVLGGGGRDTVTSTSHAYVRALPTVARPARGEGPVSRRPWAGMAFALPVPS